MKNRLLFMAGLCYALSFGFLTPVPGQSGSHILSELYDMLDPLDMTEVTSHVLYDRGLDMYNWPYYDGSVPSDSAAFSAASWSWIYTQASTSFLPGYSTLPSSFGYMDHMLDPPSANTITLASMWLDYHYLRTDAIDLNLLTLHPIDSTLHDVPARTQSPYIRDTVFMVSPLTSSMQSQMVQFGVT